MSQFTSLVSIRLEDDLKYIYTMYMDARRLRMEATSVKQAAQRMVAELDEGATWEDLMYKIYVRQAIEKGLQDSEAGRTLDVGQVRARFGLNL
jgi:predicted transcriptional regulator